MTDDLFEREAMIGSRVAIAGFFLLLLVSVGMLLFTDSEAGEVSMSGRHYDTNDPVSRTPGQVELELDVQKMQELLDATGKLGLLPKNSLVVIDFVDGGKPVKSFGIVGTSVHAGGLAEYDLVISIDSGVIPAFTNSNNFCTTLASVWDSSRGVSVDFSDPLKAVRYLTFKKSCVPSIPMTGGAISELPEVKRAISAIIIWVILFTSAILVIKLRVEHTSHNSRRDTKQSSHRNT